MTEDEKLAEEWLDERYLKDMGVRKPCKEAFLAGLKAGKEIDKSRRMTHKELSRWLKEKPTREWKYTDGDYTYSVYCYKEKYADEEVHNSILIREDDGEWREPFVKVKE